MWDKLNELLGEKKMSKRELSRQTGLSIGTIQNIRYRSISFANMVKIADVLDVSLDKFR